MIIDKKITNLFKKMSMRYGSDKIKLRQEIDALTPGQKQLLNEFQAQHANEYLGVKRFPQHDKTIVDLAKRRQKNSDELERLHELKRIAEKIQADPGFMKKGRKIIDSPVNGQLSDITEITKNVDDGFVYSVQEDSLTPEQKQAIQNLSKDEYDVRKVTGDPIPYNEWVKLPMGSPSYKVIYTISPKDLTDQEKAYYVLRNSETREQAWQAMNNIAGDFDTYRKETDKIVPQIMEIIKNDTSLVKALQNYEESDEQTRKDIAYYLTHEIGRVVAGKPAQEIYFTDNLNSQAAYFPEDNKIALDNYWVVQSTAQDLIKSAAHENTHYFQHANIMKYMPPLLFEISGANYIRGDNGVGTLNDQRYRTQPVEEVPLSVGKKVSDDLIKNNIIKLKQYNNDYGF